MRVIILKDDKTLGKANTIIDVANGYAQNVLIPKGFVEPATPDAINRMNNRIAKSEYEYNRNRAQALDMTKKLRDLEEIIIGAECSKIGKMFGAVTSKDICDYLNALNIPVEKKSIDLSKSIKSIGEYEVKINLFDNISENITLHVIPKKI